jgi:ABC-type cobalt transport system substrate-binding protein
MSKKQNVLRIFGSSALVVLTYIALVLNLSPIRLLLFGGGLSLFFGGCWQLDLLAAQAFWSLDGFILDRYKPFLLPFNIPVSKQIAYCLFFSWILVGMGIVMFTLGVTTI